MRPRRVIVLLPYLVLLAACGDDGQNEDGACAAVLEAADYHPAIDPASFAPAITNRFLPYKAGTVFRYEEGDKRVTTTVTAEQKTVLGVACTVVHDVEAMADGLVLEDTYDWYAQDKDGNVWYFGEDTKAYQDGKVISTLGSWEAGKDCAQPGIVMQAEPKVGDSYRQEFLLDVAEDRADVVALDQDVSVRYGAFKGCLKTKDYSDLEPGKAEHKYYCLDVGQVLAEEIVAVGPGDREELVAVDGQ